MDDKKAQTQDELHQGKPILTGEIVPANAKSWPPDVLDEVLFWMSGKVPNAK